MTDDLHKQFEAVMARSAETDARWTALKARLDAEALARRKRIRLWTYGVFTLITLAVYLIFWPQWVHVPWWQTLILLGAIQGFALNGAHFTRAALGDL